MTENMAARGEGLAGLAKAILAYDDEFMTVLVSGRSVEQEKADYAWAAIIKQATLLEAAAPAGTARPLRFAHDNDSLEDFVRCLAQATIYRSHDTGDVIGEYWREEVIEWVKEFGAALATPSPQAPERLCDYVPKKEKWHCVRPYMHRGDHSPFVVDAENSDAPYAVPAATEITSPSWAEPRKTPLVNWRKK